MPAPNICLVVGARPNFMKVAPVYHAIEAMATPTELLLVHTGQHYDKEMSSIFIDELELPLPDVFLGVGSGTHGEQTAKALVGMESLLLERSPDLVVVAGDVNSTLAAALAASKLRIPVAHIESGLRSFDESMPEEANRRLTDHLSSLLFAHSESALENLTREGIASERQHFVGNTMIDSVFRYLPTALAREPWVAFDVEPGRYVLVTLHRPALVDDSATLRRVIDALGELAESLPVLFPVHPRTLAQLSDGNVSTDALRVCAPLGYLDFLGLQAKAAFVLTDSGGVQEETSALGVRCFTLRSSTERPVTVELGTNTVIGADPRGIARIPELLDADPPAETIPLWDGHAGERVAARIAEFVATRHF